MAKHKKKRAHKVSKGLRSSISRSLVNSVRADRTHADKMLNKLNAWKAGKHGYVTIPNPENDTSRPFIKVTFNAYFGGGRDYKTIKAGVKPADDKNRIEL